MAAIMAISSSFIEQFSRLWWLERGQDSHIYIMKGGSRLCSSEKKDHTGSFQQIGHILDARVHTITSTGKKYIVVRI